MDGVIACIFPEVAVDQILHTYSGGLGVYGQGFALSAYKLKKKLVIVAPLPKQGYYDQVIRAVDGREKMATSYVNRSYEGILHDTGVKFTIPLGGTHNWCKVDHLSAGRFGNVDIFFWSTDLDENDTPSRENSLQLYGGSRESGSNTERKIAQSIILGRASIEALRHLGIHVSRYHMNESYAGTVALVLLMERIEQGMSLEEAVVSVRLITRFTTHTPVRAGNPEYDFETFVKVWGDAAGVRDTFLEIGGNPFNMTAACLKLAGRSNTVSKKHLDVAERMWAWVPDRTPLISITNGVSQDFWQDAEFRDTKTPEALAQTKKPRTEMLCRVVHMLRSKRFDPNVLTAVWARRFAEYKRPKLIFRNLESLRARLASSRLQLIVAGKPHPDDDGMIEMFNTILGYSAEFPNLAVIPGYELELSKLLKEGAHLWINTPRAPDEACGTSGMSAAMNGAVNISTRDGWMCEADQDNFFPFGVTIHSSDQDILDGDELVLCFDQLEGLFYNDQPRWWQMALAAKQESERQWTSDRMVEEYFEKLYI